MDAVLGKPPSQVICHRPNAGCGQAIGAGGQAAHHELKKSAADIETAVEEYAAQEGPEETVDDGLREALLLQTSVR